ncbi:TBC domain-containing protein [Coniochaeta sp. 2T2.1]|nr:TBC domain-containing protein [Coniochaeta sp. 2T2.1]
MDSESAAAAPLERSVSQHSTTSIRSHRSGTVRPSKSRKATSQPSSSASSIAPSDKSLTSFPSFSPKAQRNGPPLSPPQSYDEGFPNLPSQSSTGSRPRAPTVADILGASSPQVSEARNSLFEDAPISTQKIPGALHLANDEHLKRLITRHGAVNLVRQIAEDLAQRDAQISALRRKADERERALRKIILECGLSNLDLETRLRAIEQESKSTGHARRALERGVTDLMNDAMKDDVRSPFGTTGLNEATIRASTLSLPSEIDNSKNTTRGWKDYLWGGTTKGSRASSMNEEARKPSPQTVIRNGGASERRPIISDDFFSPPDTDSPRSSSRASSVHSGQTGPTARKASLASLALRLVAGGTSTVRESDSRGRTNSGATTGSMRTPSVSSAATGTSARAVSVQSGPKALMAMRRTTGPHNIHTNPVTRTQMQDHLDTNVTTGAPGALPRQESYGPVEMDTILPPEVQPPTLSYLHNNYNASGYLTDRFGFIYDQRRKKRQRDAAQMIRTIKQGNRTEMLTNGRSSISPVMTDDAGIHTKNSEGAGDTDSLGESRDEVKPRRWQDYLKIATFPTELLSHTPSSSVPGLEIMEGGEVPKSPGLTADDRGFVPATSTTTAVDHDTQPSPDAEQPTGTLVKEDAEPVKLLLRQLSDVHDALQREKTIRWNEFLRKVRAERKREREAEEAAAIVAAEARFQRAAKVMPETKLADGEVVGVAGLGNKGKVGRAKWNEFKNLVLGGIPVSLRAKVWTESSGAGSLRVPGYYEGLVNRPAEDDDPQVVAQIKADITRTLTDNIFFRKGPGVERLNEVLLAYSRRNIEVGYCQGMNLVAANLLLIMPTAEDAFWILVSIIENILPRGYYDHSLLASRADQQVLRSYVSEVLPKLSQHFEELSIDLETMTFQWFLSVFTDCLSAEALFRVWDVVLCTNDGSTFLFQVALALLKLNESQLLACSSPASIYTYINHQMTNHAISIDGLIQASEGLRRVVKREEVEARRAKAIEAERELGRQREERDAQRRLKKVSSASSAVKSTQGDGLGSAASVQAKNTSEVAKVGAP